MVCADLEEVLDALAASLTPNVHVQGEIGGDVEHSATVFVQVWRRRGASSGQVTGSTDICTGPLSRPTGWIRPLRIVCSW
jgi:hypothetical protein